MPKSIFLAAFSFLNFGLAALFLSSLGSCGGGLGLDENADTAIVGTSFIDTIQLVQGKIPRDWEKITLPEGFYIGFPKKPNRQEQFGHFVKYLLRQQEYALFFSHRDLSKEASFEPNRGERTAYYRAVINDIAESLQLDEIKTKIVDESPFLAFEMYEGVQATIVATDGVHIYMRAVIVGNTMFTTSCTAWQNPSKSTLLIKDLFLYSFGKELLIK
jgi:hypothetical protein